VCVCVGGWVGLCLVKCGEMDLSGRRLTENIIEQWRYQCRESSMRRKKERNAIHAMQGRKRAGFCFFVFDAF